jgi:hypothetical protein
MQYLVGFIRFWYDFIIGDDWTIAVSVALSVVATFWLVHSNIQAWWLLPLAAIITLGVSLLRNA